MSHISSNSKHLRPITNLQEVITNKSYRQEIGFIDGKYYFRGKEYSKEELDEMFKTDFVYEPRQIDGRQIVQ